tara:strand:- start:56 stop:571 length:516 start_codon:yes stop_codon:yes gene_type:complete
VKKIHKNWDVFINEGRNIIIVASVICIDENEQILILLRGETAPRHPLHWDLPGGHVDQTDGSVEAGGVRELQEEAGLKASIEDLQYLDKTIKNVTRNGSPREIIRHFFITEKWTGDVSLVPNPETDILEHIEYKWATFDEIQELSQSSIPNYILRKALNKIRNQRDDPHGT